ncbi:MAG: hypothetical protein JW965_03415 [Bacteroidales bacterium]|nr:hypothetical protein [Bacteroidales bacterium]
MKKYFSLADVLVIATTFILFAAALFAKGFTNALLLEAGVLLVSVKIIMMNYKLSQTNKKILGKLEAIEKNINK